MKNSFKPTQRTISPTQTAANKVPMITANNVTAALWDLMLLEGIAQLSAGAPLVSGTVAFWLSNTASPTIGNADIVTFTDGSGYYAVTVKAGRGYKIKLYS